MENYSTYYQNRRLKLLLNIAIAASLVICGFFIFLIVHGYSMVRLDVPSGTSININDHVVTSNLLKMRPGNYQIIISSPIIMPYQGSLHVGLFGTTTYKPILKQRSVNAIASSVIGAEGSAGPPQPGLVRWFDNNTWVVGLVVPGNADLALHYNSTQQQWVVGFFNVTGYPNDLSQLPANVAGYVEQLETQHAGG